MAALGLGDIEAFPFLEPPDRRQIGDGVNLLIELGALTADRRLTPLGRRLARLPVDPRMGRMVLEADRLGCAEEVVVIAAALSIQDPRERPFEERAQADASHARFADEDSDFLAYLNLWRYLERQADALSRSQFRKRLKGEYIHYLRVREWQDLVERLRAAAREVDVHFEPGRTAERRDIGIALLSGLLSHIGLRDKARGDYAGARGARFAIFPGSGLAKKSPDWIVAAELLETSRLWGVTVARIDRRWIEPLAGSLVRREISEPRWDEHRAGVVATERVTLYGLPIVTGRRVDYGRVDPVLSRELFIRRALVDGEWDAGHEFLAENRRRVPRSRRSRSARVSADCLPPMRCFTTSSRLASPRTSFPAATSTAGGATLAARIPTASRIRARYCRRAPRTTTADHRPGSKAISSYGSRIVSSRARPTTA